MANIMNKTVYIGNLVCRRSIHASACNARKSMSDPLEHATGIEKQELLARAAGNEDPFDMKIFKRSSGELSNPTVISSFYPSRLVGCICQEDATCINWMWLNKGEPKRCECGYFFKLTDGKPMV